MTPALEDDIARIAALRGKSADHYAEQERQRQAVRRQITFQDILDTMQQGAADLVSLDLRIYDELTERARAFLRAYPFAVSAARYHDLVVRVGDEATVLRGLDLALPHLRAMWAKAHFGAEHPSVKGLER